MKKVFGKDSNLLPDQEKFDSIKNEVQVCNDLDHPFLVRMVHAFETDHFYCLVFDCKLYITQTAQEDNCSFCSKESKS